MQYCQSKQVIDRSTRCPSLVYLQQKSGSIQHWFDTARAGKNSFSRLLQPEQVRIRLVANSMRFFNVSWCPQSPVCQEYLKLRTWPLSEWCFFWKMALNLDVTDRPSGCCYYCENSKWLCIRMLLQLEIVFTRAAPAFHNLFMGCVFNINTLHKTVKKLMFQAIYWSSHWYK